MLAQQSPEEHFLHTEDLGQYLRWYYKMRMSVTLGLPELKLK